MVNDSRILGGVIAFQKATTAFHRNFLPNVAGHLNLDGILLIVTARQCPIDGLATGHELAKLDIAGMGLKRRAAAAEHIVWTRRNNHNRIIFTTTITTTTGCASRGG